MGELENMDAVGDQLGQATSVDERYNQKYEYDPDFNGIDMSDRHCTDWCCTLLFVLFICGMFALAIVAGMRSNYKFLYIPTDSRGQMCGYDNTKLKVDETKWNTSIGKEPFPFTDLTNKSYLFWVRPGKKGYSRSLCVEKCPDLGKFMAAYGASLVGDLNAQGAKDTDCGSNDQNSKRTVENYTWPLDHPGQKSYNCAYASKPFMERCIPTTEAMPDAPTEIETVQEQINAAFKSLGAVTTAVDDLYKTWKWIAAFVGGSLVLSLLYLLLLRCIAGCMVYLTVLLSLAALGFVTYCCYLQRDNQFGNAKKAEGFTFGLYSQDLNTKVFNVLFYVMCVLDVIFLLVLLFLFNRIKLSVGIIKVVSKIFGTVPGLFFFPIIIYILMFIWWIYIVGVAIVLFGAGNPVHTYEPGPTGEGTDKIEYKYDKIIQGFSIYHFVGFLWGTLFLDALGELIIAGVIAEYYFAKGPNRRENMSKHPIWQSFKRTLRYHIGSIAFGSAIITIIKVIRCAIEYIDQKTKGVQSDAVKCLIKCMKCCFWCLDKFMKYINRQVYILIAIHGYSFWPGCKQAFNLIFRNCVRVVTLNWVGDFTLFLARVFVSGCTSGLALFVFTKLIDGVTFYIVPCCLVFVMSYLAAGAFTGVFEMGIDSVFLCFMEDEERHDGSPGHELRAPDELKSFMSK